MSKMDLSIIISTWNNSNRLAITLEAISKCVIPPGLKWEIIIVNNNCTDNTDGVISQFFDKLPIIYIEEKKQGLSLARNKGLKVSKGKLVIFTDDDVCPCREWIKLYWETFIIKPKGFFFGGPVKCEYEIDNIDLELLDAGPPSVKGLYWGEVSRVLKNNEFFISANWGCPKIYLEMIGGFDIKRGLNSPGKLQSGEESELMRRLIERGVQGWYISGAWITHFVPKDKCTLRHIVSRKETIALEFAREIVKDNKWPTICSIPRWIFREIIFTGIKWFLGKCRGERRYIDYVNLRFLIRTVKAILTREI